MGTAKSVYQSAHPWLDFLKCSFFLNFFIEFVLTVCSELTKAVEPYIKQEDEGKFRCKTCLKLFKATSFVEKHIANKHSELLKVLDDVRAIVLLSADVS